MNRPRPASLVFLVVMFGSLAGLITGCSASSAEQQLLERYFSASRMRDNTTVANIATVAFRPDEEGIVQDFTITNVTPDDTHTLRLPELSEAYEQALADEEEFGARQKEYQDANMDAIERVLEAEREGGRVARRDQEVQTTWNELRAEMTEHAGNLSQAREALEAEQAIAGLSVFNAADPIDVTEYEGELTTREVTIEATVLSRTGQEETRSMVIMMHRAQLTGPSGDERSGRWVITSIEQS